MKQLKDFSLKEFDEYKEILKEGEPTDIFPLFGIDIDEISVSDYMKFYSEITTMSIPTVQIKDVYEIKGRRFKTVTLVKNIKAGQFIDFQANIKDNNYAKTLSIFLIPMLESTKMKGLLKKKSVKVYTETTYNKGYDVAEVEKFIYENFTIQDAMALSTFFLTLSLKFLARTQVFLMKRKVAEMRKLQTLKKKKITK